jgi:hypothetical protein
MSVGASVAIGGLGQSAGRQRLLKKFCSIVILSEEEGRRLLSSASSEVVEVIDGAYNPRNYGYVFVADSMHFYFECRNKIEIKKLVEVNNIFLPK